MSLDRSAKRDRSGSLKSKQAAGLHVEAVEQLLDEAGQVGAQPGHAAELQRVRRLVQRDPAQQLVGVGLELIARVGEVGRDEQQPRRLVGVEHGELVLAEHAAAEEAGDRAGLGRQDPARGAAEDAHARARLLDRGLEHAAHRAEVRVDPLAAVDGLGHGQRAVGDESGVRAHEPLRLLRRAGDVTVGRGITGGLQP